MKFPSFFPKPKPFLIRISAGCSLVAFLPWVNTWHWMLDLGSHFQLQVVICQLVLLTAFLAMKSWKAAAWSFAILMVGFFHLSPFIGWPQQQETTTDKPLRVTSLNVLFSNLEHQKVVNYLNSQNADLIFLSEINERWHRVITKQISSYPYTVTETRDDAFGTLLLSRHPITEHTMVRPGRFGEPLIHAIIDYQGTPVTFLGLHPIPPVGKNSSADNARYLDMARKLTLAAQSPLIVAGDLNATPWGAQYHHFISTNLLTSCAENSNTFTTWAHYKNPWMLPTSLMLDHIFYGEPFKKNSFTVTSGLGSDHFGLTTELSLK